MIDIQQTFIYCLPIAFAGLLGVGTAATYYTPLENNLLHDFLLLVMLILPGAMIFFLVSFDRLARYAFIFRMTLISAAATPMVTAAVLYINGAWDQVPAVSTQAFVSGKHVSGGGTRTGADLHVTLHWKERLIEEHLDVLRQTYEAVEPNDSINIIVHPGEFSLPWYSYINPDSVQRQIPPQE